MSFDSAFYAEADRRERAKIRRLTAQMNNTKWREVFHAIAHHKIGFQIAWVHSGVAPSQSIQHFRSEQLIERTGLRDPGIGGSGPCLYRDILWLRFPYALRLDDGRGHIRTVTQEIAPFLLELHSLGELPINESPQFVELLAYATPVA